MIDRLVVAGIGLIGGSFAAALKGAGAVRHVVGIGRSRASAESAKALGLIDEIGDDASAVRNADFVLIATPVGQIERLLAAIAPHLSPAAVVTDGGSTKRDVVAAARAALGAKIAQFVPGHPIAGAEKSGPSAARADLYHDRKVILTPLPENREADVARVEAAWQACGSTVYRMTPDEHDSTLAAVSHLPHVLAYALVDQIDSHPNAALRWRHAAGGFRDFTRIASSHPEMWRDICVANRDAILATIDEYDQSLAKLRGLIEHGDDAGLFALFGDARDARNRWLDEFEGRVQRRTGEE